VDYKQAPRDRTLQKYDIVKLVNFSPVVFDLSPQVLARRC
jgi:hypothetical protein